jgi:hypothetical protein
MCTGVYIWARPDQYRELLLKDPCHQGLPGCYGTSAVTFSQCAASGQLLLNPNVWIIQTPPYKCEIKSAILCAQQSKTSITATGSTMTARGGDEGSGTLKPTFDNILNFRDVGETVNTFLGRKYDRNTLLFLSIEQC